jgi:hypothetical protein
MEFIHYVAAIKIDRNVINDNNDDYMRAFLKGGEERERERERERETFFLNVISR